MGKQPETSVNERRLNNTDVTIRQKIKALQERFNQARSHDERAGLLAEISLLRQRIYLAQNRDQMTADEILAAADNKNKKGRK